MCVLLCVQRRFPFLWLGCLAASWLFAAPALAEPDDIVFLKNGGRARGAVIEADPGAGARLRLQDGTLRSFPASAIDHIEYGAPGAPPAASVVATPSAPISSAAERSAFLGAVRVESREPGDVFVEGGEYGATPVVITNLSVGPHRIQVRFHAGDDETRTVVVRGGAETPVHFEVPASLRALRAHNGLRFGAGIDCGVGLVGEDPVPGFRVFGRMNYAVSRGLELRADARLGLFPGSFEESDGSYYSYHSGEALFGLALRGDAQFNLGSIYTMSIGVDLGVAAKSGVFAGGHFSPIGFRMGSERSFLIALQAGLLSGDRPIGDLTLALSYLL